MSRIFFSLSILPILLVFVTMGVGWWIGDYNAAYQQFTQSASQPSNGGEEQLLAELELMKEPQRRFAIHFQLGLASALATVLINSLSVTYLIGTSRWVKEVCEAYGLDAKYEKESTGLKRRTFPWSIAGVFSVITIVALGAASDPGTLRGNTSNWVLPHMVAAMVGVCVIVWAVVVQAMNLHRNAEIINTVVAEVQRERAARGLPVESA